MAEITTLEIFGHNNPITVKFQAPLRNVTHIKLLAFQGTHAWLSVPDELVIRGEGTNEALTIPSGNYGLISLLNVISAGNFQGIDISYRRNNPYSAFYLEVRKGILPPYLKHLLGLDNPPVRAIELSSLITADDTIIHCDMVDPQHSLLDGKPSQALATFYSDHQNNFRGFVNNDSAAHERKWEMVRDAESFRDITLTLKNSFGMTLKTYHSPFHYTITFLHK